MGLQTTGGCLEASWMRHDLFPTILLGNLPGRYTLTLPILKNGTLTFLTALAKSLTKSILFADVFSCSQDLG